MKKKITAIFLCIALAATAIVGASLAYFTDTTQVEQNVFTMGKVDITLDEPTWDEKYSEDIKAMNPGKVYDKDPTITVDKDSMDSYIFLDVTFNKYSSLFWVMAADASADTTTDGLENFTIFNTDGNMKTEYCKEVAQENGTNKQVFSTTKFLQQVAENKKVREAIVNKWFGGIEHEDWQLMKIEMNSGKDKNCITFRLAYIGDSNNDGIVTAAEVQKNGIVFMNKFGMPASVTQDMIAAGQTVGGMANAFNTNNGHNFNLYFTAYAIQADQNNDIETAYRNMFGEEPAGSWTIAS